MTLMELLLFFREETGWTESGTTGKIDNNKEKAVCFYNSHLRQRKRGTIGGKANRGYEQRPISILLRWTTSAAQAEQKAQEIYDFFDELEFTHQGKRVFCILIYDRPVDLGTGEGGVFEYSIPEA